MKILMVAIPNHHFFQWVNQLKNSGYEVFWFDITDGGPKSNKINWVTQLKNWKLKWDFPLRSTIKKLTPKLYNFIQRFNDNNVSNAFQKKLELIKPDIVHCFEMKLSGLPILNVMNKNKIPFVYSSWGSDAFYFKQLGVTKKQLKRFYKRVDFLITDCKRDYKMVSNNGFDNTFLGVFPGNGGLEVDASKILSISKRNTILIKGYDDGVGKASKVIEALLLVPKKLIQDKKIVIYSADKIIQTLVKNSKRFSELPITIYSRYKFIQNKELLTIMGKSCIHIGNSISDGMPNALLEAMAMGTFPIQSNPGGVTEEVIKHGENGFLINNPLNEKEIANHIIRALEDENLINSAKKFNVNFINKHYNRFTLQPKIEELYKTVKNKTL